MSLLAFYRIDGGGFQRKYFQAQKQEKIINLSINIIRSYLKLVLDQLWQWLEFTEFSVIQKLLHIETVGLSRYYDTSHQSAMQCTFFLAIWIQHTWLHMYMHSMGSLLSAFGR